ncbi:hypothetical protein Tsubulata_001062 [Turnera subulata]|uniref:GDSL esterase/lipase 7-like n=1 Tax=Turnera subulata TaxID=218843 RepID=A0A9Q0J858_9ROSI|nr:hypothetical protein Tsubulata_001062 [Turnera subulata]
MIDAIIHPMALVFLFVFTHFISLASSADPLAPALYVFGDSLFDSGNNNYLPTAARANFRPYGFDFVDGETGRFTNGRTVPDFFAEFLGLPYAPPYMRLRLSTPLTGLNYASASCGILPETGRRLGKCLNLDEQIDLFEHTVNKQLPKHFKSTEELLQYLSKSLFFVSVGNNDYMSNYFDHKHFDTSTRFTPEAFAQFLVDRLAEKFQRLYNIGARKVVMYEIGPIGCVPSFAKRHEHNGTCHEEANQMAKDFNDKLHVMLQNLTTSLQGSIFVHNHAHWIGYDAVINPPKYGLVDTGNACCETWSNGTSGCIPFRKPCPNPNANYFFDAFHLSETVCNVLASRCMNDTTACTPVLNDVIKM